MYDKDEDGDDDFYISSGELQRIREQIDLRPHVLCKEQPSIFWDYNPKAMLELNPEWCLKHKAWAICNNHAIWCAKNYPEVLCDVAPSTAFAQWCWIHEPGLLYHLNPCWILKNKEIYRKIFNLLLWDKEKFYRVRVKCHISLREEDRYIEIEGRTEEEKLAEMQEYAASPYHTLLSIKHKKRNPKCHLNQSSQAATTVKTLKARQ